MSNDPVIDALEAIYAELPTVECRGLCWNSCGPIDMSPAERERIEERGVHIQPYTSERGELWAGNIVAIVDNETGEQLRLDCAALTPMKRCSVYDVRPFICRAYGAGRGEMACRHGCTVSGRRLRADEIFELQVRVKTIGGGFTEEERDRLLAVHEDPEVRQLLRRLSTGGDDPVVRPQLLALLARRTNEVRGRDGDVSVLPDEQSR